MRDPEKLANAAAPVRGYGAAGVNYWTGCRV